MTLDRTKWVAEMAEMEPARPAAHPVSLSDALAIDRTILANERTLLAYVRTSLGLLAIGVTFLDFLEGWAYAVCGWLFIVTGPVVLVAGIARYLRARRRLTALAGAGMGE